MVAFSVKVHSIYHVGGTPLGEPREIIHANLHRVTADGMENARWKNFDKTFRLSVSQTLRPFKVKTPSLPYNCCNKWHRKTLNTIY